MTVQKKKTKRIKFETKLLRAALKKTEKDSFRQLLAQDAETPEADLSPDEIHTYREQAKVSAARIVEKGVRDASESKGHSHNT